MSGKRKLTDWASLKSENASVSDNAPEKESENASVNTPASVSESTDKSETTPASTTGIGNIDVDTIVSKKAKKPKFEETHTKNTYWIRNDILEVLNKIATNRGEKTQAINEGLMLYFEQLQNRK